MADTVKTKVGILDKNSNSNANTQRELEKSVKKQEMAKAMNKMGEMGGE